MIKFRIFFIFCVLHQWQIINAASTKRHIRKESNVCLTSECKNAASEIELSIDPKAAPCDDFYKFACGNYLKTAVIKEGDTFADRYNSLDHKNKDIIKKNLEEPIQPNEPKYITLSKNFYKGCMDEAGIEKNGLRTIVGHLKKMGGWPVVEGDSWEEKNFDWIQTTYDLRNLGYNTFYLFTFSVYQDYKNSSRSILNIDQPFLSIDREFSAKGLNDPIVKAYYNYMVDMAVIFGANKSRAEKELKDALEFLTKLGSLTLSSEKEFTEDTPKVQITVKEVTNKYPGIPWKEYFNTFLKSIAVIGDDELITVNNPNFFEKFLSLIKETPKRVLANYLLWEAVQEGASYTTKELMKAQTKYATLRWGPTSAKIGPRGIICLENTINMLGISTGALYIRKNFNQKSKKKVEELAVAIEEQLKKSLKEVDWMDEKTRTSALDKIESIKNSIGSIDQYFDEKAISEYYKTVEITPNNYLEAYLNMTRLTSTSFLRQLRKPVKKSDWPLLIHAQTFGTNAQYDGKSNSIDIPAGILQDIFFNENRPQYLNFAGIGSFILANKITRAIDNDGRSSDKNGDLKDWWTAETKKGYLKKSACINQQYASYTLQEHGFKLNENKTIEKNIADNGGVKISYLAYQDWVKRNGPEPTLPGLKYSQSQLFWIQAAVTQCAKYTPEFLKSVEMDNVWEIINEFNTPSEFRVSGLFANRPEFAKDFNCPVGSKMNPAKKCSEW